MKPKAGYDYLATAAHFAAESSTGTNVNVCTTDDFTKSVDALVYYIDPDNEEMKIAYPTLLFDRNITDGRAMMCSVLTLSIGNNQGMGDVEYGKIYDIYFPPAYLRLFDGPNCNVVDMWRILNRGMSNGGLIVGTIIKPKLGLQPKPFGEACYAFWQGGRVLARQSLYYRLIKMETTVMYNCLFFDVSILIPLFRQNPEATSSRMTSLRATRSSAR
jgi:ribulose-bisphosphate carboxylase large chain